MKTIKISSKTLKMLELGLWMAMGSGFCFHALFDVAQDALEMAFLGWILGAWCFLRAIRLMDRIMTARRPL